MRQRGMQTLARGRGTVGMRVRGKRGMEMGIRRCRGARADGGNERMVI
jgi:hypothetical protein